MAKTIQLLGGIQYKELTYWCSNFDQDTKYFNQCEKAWMKQNIVLQRVKDSKDADVLVFKSSSDAIRKQYGARIADSGLSLTDRGASPMQIHILEANWNALPKHRGTDFTDLDMYRVAILNHEFAHALGHDHVSCPCKNAETCTLPMDIRQQPSRSLGGCKPVADVIFHKTAKHSNVNF